MLSFTLGVLMLFNIIVFSPITTTEVEAVTTGDGYKMITAYELWNDGAIPKNSGASTVGKIDTGLISSAGNGLVNFQANADYNDDNVVLDISSYGINSTDYGYMVIVGSYQVYAGGSSATVFYSNSGYTDPVYAASRSASYDTVVSGQHTGYVLNVSQIGAIEKIRFDVFNGHVAGDKFFLSSIIFCANDSIAQAMAWKGAAMANGRSATAPVFSKADIGPLFDLYINRTMNVPENSAVTVSYDTGADAFKLYANADKPDPNHIVDLEGMWTALGATFSADTYKYIVVTYKVHLDLDARQAAGDTLEPAMMLYLMAGEVNTPQLAYDNKMTPGFEVKDDGQYHSVIVDTTQMAGWTGNIHGFRFDFLGTTYAGEYMLVDSIGFYQAGTGDGTLVPAGDAAIANIMARGYDDSTKANREGQLYAYYDVAAMFNEYRYPVNSAFSVGYDEEEEAIRVEAIKDKPDPFVTIAFNDNINITVSNSPYLVLTYMIPEECSHYSTGRVFIYTDTITSHSDYTYSVPFDLIPDGKYHSYVIDLNTLDGKANWKDADHITGIRFDYVDSFVGGGSTSVEAGSYIYIDSILFKSTLATANAAAWARNVERNYVDGEFIATPELLPAFYMTYSTGNAATINVSFDGTEDAIKFDVATGGGDPQVHFDLAKLNASFCLDSDDYDYMVITYKSNCAMYDAVGGSTVETFHFLGDKSAQGGYSTYKPGVSDLTQYHAVIMEMTDAKYDGTTYRGFRFDFVGTATTGDVFYVDSIIYCKTLDEAYDTAWDRTWYRNHERGTGGKIEDTFGHWEQQYLMEEHRTSVDTASSPFAEDLIVVNGDANNTFDAVSINGSVTYNLAERGYLAKDFKSLRIDYQSTVNGKYTVYFMTDAATTKAEALAAGTYVSGYIYSDVDETAGNEYHSILIELSDKYWWTVNNAKGDFAFNGFCVEFTDINGDPTTVYIESAELSGSDWEDVAYEVFDEVNAINGITITNAGKTEYIFKASPELAYLVIDRHMCEITYDVEQKALAFTVCDYCNYEINHGIGTHKPNGYTCCPGFDVGARLLLPEGGVPIASNQYLVVAYMTPTTANGLSDIITNHTNPSTGNDHTINTMESLGHRIPVTIFPTIAGRGEDAKYRRIYPITEQDTYYAQFLDLYQTGYEDSVLDCIRIDPFDITFSSQGSKIYFPLVALASTEVRAQEIVDSVLDSRYPYNFVMEFNAGDGTGDPTLADIPEGEQGSRKKVNEYSFDVAYATPTRANYDFVAWKNEHGVIIDKGEKITLYADPGATSKVTVSTTLTAQWEEKVATLTYKIVGPDGVVGCGALSGDLTASGSQLVKVLNGSPSNVTITPGDSFMFVGWYLDEACTVLVTNQAVLTTDMMATNKTTNLDSTSISSYPTVWGDITYYAKVEYAHADLTIFIEKDEELEDDQKFIVTVSEAGIHNSIDFTSITVVPTEVVTVDGTDYYKIVIKQLYGGTYTVTLDNWNWRYGYQGTLDGVATSQVFIHDSAREYIFKYNGVSNGSWLNGCGYNDGSN